jgi:hypothetical protein
MNKILETLKGLLPEDQVKQIEAAVEETLAERDASLEKEYNAKLEEAYAELAKQVEKEKADAEEGYKEAYAIIEDLRNRQEIQRVEFEKAMEEGYEEAYQMILAERSKNEKLELEMFDSYDQKLQEMKEYMVDMIDQFLQSKTVEMYENARRDVLQDPAMVEHKLTLDRIVETVSEYITDEDFALATSKKLDDVTKAFEDAKAQQKILEARNIRLSMENKKLNETVKAKEDVITEQVVVQEKQEKKERVEKAQNATGRGQLNEGFIPEPVTTEAVKEEEPKQSKLFDQAYLEAARALAGTKK